MTIWAVEQFRRRLLSFLAASSRLAIALALGILAFPPSAAQVPQSPDPATPPRVAQARRFLQQRNWPSRRARIPSLTPRPNALVKAQSTASSTAVWQPIGPTAVLTPQYGLVTGRVSSIAIDPADVTGNHVYIGTTGGGVWTSQNAASSGNVVFTPLTDSTSAFDSSSFGSISIGAVTVQPGSTGVILAGTGDPNDALDSYYGVGILRSTDNGATWSTIPSSADQIYTFMGEGFADFAWSTVNPQLVVAAVSQSYEGTLVNAPSKNASYAGIYYSTDAGASWSLARITDGQGSDVQGPTVSFAKPNGNSVTAVVWNPVRRLFIAAVRFHGYYQSADGITWTRMNAQPGLAITSKLCPSNRGTIGSIACPVFRGALAVNPQTGDTFAWTVDLYNQDQGLWQDACAIANGSCVNQQITFAKQWDTKLLQTQTSLGPTTIANGDYNLALAAVQSQQDTIVLAGANDLWRCSLAVGCQWRNTTNANNCMSAQVAPYQHALAWNPANPQEILIGNDSGLWRSMDAVNESNSVCTSDDASHFQNLNSGLGSLAEVQSFAIGADSRFSMMVGLGANGTAGIKSNNGPVDIWPQILSGEGGPVAISSGAIPEAWYANASAGVSIYGCFASDSCTPDAFGDTPMVDNNDVAGDGFTMTTPAPFIIDPLDSSQILVGTCRLWRGPADGSGWTLANAISPFLDGIKGQTYCRGNSLIRQIAAQRLQDGSEVIYVGMFGSRSGGATIGGHILKTIFTPGSSSPSSWSDLTFNPVSNDQIPFNYFGMDISSIFIDPHDVSGNTVYVTVVGVPDMYEPICTVYRTIDGGSNWSELTSNLPSIPANDIVIDPGDASTAYIATDDGVYSTRQISSCTAGKNYCWSRLGAGLPDAPVTHLAASSGVLTAGTYGRGLWQTPLWSVASQLTSISADQNSITFPSQNLGTVSSPQVVRLQNTGAIPLTIAAIRVTAPFNETDDCKAAPINPGAICSLQVTFHPDTVGVANGALTVEANISGGQISINLAGTGFSDSLLTVSPGTLDFGQVAIGSVSNTLPVTIQNAAPQSAAISSITASAPFSLAANPCGSSVAGNSACALSVAFSPTQAGSATGTLTVVDGAGTQTVELKGIGATPATDALSESSITFPPTAVGQKSDPENVALLNSGDLPLKSIAISSTAGFQVADTCGGTLGVRAKCVITIVFVPLAEGSVSGVATVSDALRTQTIALTGTGLRSPAIQASPAQIVFPSQVLGQKAHTSLTITNTGEAPMADVGFQITGTGSPNFSFGQSTCGSSVQGGGSCSVQVTFAPTSLALLSATLTVSSSTAGVAPVQVPLSGIGQGASGITISPVQMSFTQTKLGQASAAQVATISNTSTMPATELFVSVSAPFSLVQNTCGPILEPGSTCSTGVVFTPTANALVNGTLSVSSAAFTDPAIAVLEGEGGAAGTIQIQPGLLAFASTGVGVRSPTKRVTLTNNGPVTLRELQLSISNSFAIAGTSCGTPLALAATCTVDIAFSPSNAGQQDGQVTISSESIATPVTLPLSGMGFDFTIAIAGQSSKTVSSGQTAAFSLTLTPLSGSTGTFTFSCSGLPVNSSCSFNPVSESVPANMSGGVSVNVSTGAPSTADLRESTRRRGLHWLPLLCLVGLPFAVRSGSRKRWILVLMVGVIGIASCAGAGGGGTGGAPGSTGNNTPAGTYSVVINASGGGVTHSTTVKLIVD